MAEVKTADDMAPNKSAPQSGVVDADPADRPENQNQAAKYPLGAPADNVPEPPTSKHTSDDDPTGQTSDSNTVKANIEGKDPEPGTIVNSDSVGRRPGQDKYEGVDYEHRKRHGKTSGKE